MRVPLASISTFEHAASAAVLLEPERFLAAAVAPALEEAWLLVIIFVFVVARFD